MTKHAKLLNRILIGWSDSGVPFSALCNLLEQLGFVCELKEVITFLQRYGVDEIITLQPKKNMAKVYQVKQVRNIIIKYKLGIVDNV